MSKQRNICIKMWYSSRHSFTNSFVSTRYQRLASHWDHTREKDCFKLKSRVGQRATRKMTPQIPNRPKKKKTPYRKSGVYRRLWQEWESLWKILDMGCVSCHLKVHQRATKSTKEVEGEESEVAKSIRLRLEHWPRKRLRSWFITTSKPGQCKKNTQLGVN